MALRAIPKPDECFIRYHAAKKQMIYYPNHFSVKGKTLNEIGEAIDKLLSSSMFEITSPWYGKYTSTGSCRFAIFIYKDGSEYVIEAIRLDGDRFAFGVFYNRLQLVTRG